MRTKILHLCPTGNWAGTEEIMSRMANAAIDEFDVAVALLADSPLNDKEIRSRFHERVELVFLSSQSSHGERAAELVESVSHVDIVHAHLRPGLDLARRLPFDAPTLGHVHVRYFASQFRDVDALACVAQWQISDLPDDLRIPSFYVPNWIDPFHVNDQHEIDRFKQQLGLRLTTPIVGAVGRLSEEKGVDQLVSAFLGLPKTVEAQLLIMGDGPELESLVALSEGDNRIFFAGYVPNARAMLPALDVFASCSRLESFGLSLAEAMTCGLRTVATASRGSCEVLEGQPTSPVPIDDTKALTEALANAIEDVHSNRPLPDYDVSGFAPERSIPRLYDCYRHLTKPWNSLVASNRASSKSESESYDEQPIS